MATRMFVTAVPGLNRLVSRELGQIPGVTVREAGGDGRSDMLFFESAGLPRRGLDLAEDAFVEVGRTRRAEGDQAGWIASRVWRPGAVERALADWTALARPPRRRMTFRVVTRVLQERSFRRTELRHQLTRTIQQGRQGWRPADPANLEVWITEYRPGSFVAGLRLPARQRPGRAVELRGSLLPSVAAAMVRLAGPPDGILVDQCCGSGTILAEARAAGWQVRGFDLAPEAVGAARRNVAGVAIEQGDARHLALPDAAVGACVANLPFGRQFTVPGERAAWLREVLAEMARVTRPGGRIVLLAPDASRSAAPASLRLRERAPIRLLGTRTTIWAYERADS